MVPNMVPSMPPNMTMHCTTYGTIAGTILNTGSGPIYCSVYKLAIVMVADYLVGNPAAAIIRLLSELNVNDTQADMRLHSAPLL